MAETTVQLPNGQTVTVAFPDGASDDQVLEFVKREYDAGRLGQPTQLQPDLMPQPTPNDMITGQMPVNQSMQPQQSMMPQAGMPAEQAQPDASWTNYGTNLAKQLAQNKIEANQNAVGAMENIGSIASGAIGDIVGGWAGLLSMPFVGADEAANVVRDLSDFLTYEPRTEAGKSQQKAIGEFLSPVAEWMVEKPGDAAYDMIASDSFQKYARESGNPALIGLANDPALAGAMGASAPTAILELLGLKGISRAKNAKAARQSIADEILAGNRTVDNIIDAVDQNGQLMKGMNKPAQNIVKLFDKAEDGKKAAITFESLDSADNAATLEMLDIMEKGRKRGRQYVMENRPADIIGRGVAERIKEVKNLRKQASAEMEKALPRLRNQTVDMSTEANQLMNTLANNDVRITRNDKGRYQLDFANSPMTLGDGVKKSDLERLLNLTDLESKNGAQVHGIKKFAQQMVDYNPSLVARKTSPEVENAIKNLAAGYNRKLRDLDDGYAAANDIYSSSADAMTEAQKFLKNINIESSMADKRLGNISKRIASNFTSRDNVMTMIDELESVLRQNDVPVKGDIKRQVATLAEIEDIFRLEREQSPFGLTGRIESVVQAANDPTGAGALRGLEGGLQRIREWRTPDFDQRMRILRQTLREE